MHNAVALFHATKTASFVAAQFVFLGFEPSFVQKTTSRKFREQRSRRQAADFGPKEKRCGLKNL